jgi:hypothetical protein
MWTKGDQDAIKEAAFNVGQNMSSRTGGDPWDAFNKYHGDIELSMDATGQDGFSCERAAYGIACHNATGAISPRFIAHEFAHVFNAQMENSGLGSPYDVLRASTILDKDGNWVEGINGDGVWQRTFAGYQGERAPSVYHGREFDDWDSEGEDFADMYMNYFLGGFAENPAGIARKEWMNDQMNDWIR